MSWCFFFFKRTHPLSKKKKHREGRKNIEKAMWISLPNILSTNNKYGFTKGLSKMPSLGSLSFFMKVITQTLTVTSGTRIAPTAISICSHWWMIIRIFCARSPFFIEFRANSVQFIQIKIVRRCMQGCTVYCKFPLSNIWWKTEISDYWWVLYRLRIPRTISGMIWGLV